jgi:pyruvate ferredoxin oxidoreductase gamma subunit
MIVINSKDITTVPSDIKKKWTVAITDANLIARETLGVPIVNTTMLGALIRTSAIVKLESLSEPLQKRFGRLADKNFKAMKRAFDEVQIKEKDNA